MVQSLTQSSSEGESSPCDDIVNPEAVAKAAGLRYVHDTSPGIRRKRVGKHFSYIGLDGKPIHDKEELRRIRSLGIPPAWTNVWICPKPNGHMQATGRDARGRKQYRYHPRWREVRDATKYNRMIEFGESLPDIRSRIAHDLKLQGLPHEKVLAVVIWLLDATAIRVGNAEYARENKSFGLTTLRNRHVDIAGSKVHFHFRGKSGKEHAVTVQNRQLARIIKRCQDLPGYELFQYLDDDGKRSTVESDDVNNYLREISGRDFTAKDFRTWAGTVFATSTLIELGAFETQAQAKKNINQAIDVAAAHLGNTKTICRKCYIHPGVIDAYMEGNLLSRLEEQEKQKKQDRHPKEAMEATDTDGLRLAEVNVLAFLKESLE